MMMSCSTIILTSTVTTVWSIFAEMDLKSLSELLKGTLDPTHRNEAEKKLSEVHKIIGFGPVLLQVIMLEASTCQVTTLTWCLDIIMFLVQVRQTVFIF